MRVEARAVVVVAELLVEVVDDTVRPPPADRDGVHVDQADRGHDGRGPQKGPAEAAEVVPPEAERAAEKVRRDRDEIVPHRERDRLPAGLATQGRLRHERIRDDEHAEGQRERIGDTGPERQRARPDRIARDPEERDRKQDLLPRRDQGQRRPAHAGRVEPRHRGVVDREPDDEGVERDDGAAPAHDPRDPDQDRVDRKLDRRHPPRVQRRPSELVSARDRRARRDSEGPFLARALGSLHG